MNCRHVAIGDIIFKYYFFIVFDAACGMPRTLTVVIVVARSGRVMTGITRARA